MLTPTNKDKDTPTINGPSCSLYPNADKRDPMHPDLRGRLTLEDRAFEVALWTRQTKDRTRIYHSATISEPFHKGETPRPPLAKGLKLYEFRKRRDSDPDFQSVEGFELLGAASHLALWVEVGAGDDLEALKFTLALLKEPYAVELTADCQQTLASLRDRMRARAREAEEEREYKEHQAAVARGEGNDELDTEPSELPFLARGLKIEPLIKLWSHPSILNRKLGAVWNGLGVTE
jgi:hypothetical protein